MSFRRRDYPEVLDNLLTEVVGSDLNPVKAFSTLILYTASRLWKTTLVTIPRECYGVSQAYDCSSQHDR